MKFAQRLYIFLFTYINNFFYLEKIDYYISKIHHEITEYYSESLRNFLVYYSLGKMLFRFFAKSVDNFF